MGEVVGPSSCSPQSASLIHSEAPPPQHSGRWSELLALGFSRATVQMGIWKSAISEKTTTNKQTNKWTRIAYKIRSTNDSLLLNCKQIKTYRLQGLKMRLHSFAPLVVPGACKNWRKHQVHVLHMRTVLLVTHILLKKQTLSVFLLKATLQ